MARISTSQKRSAGPVAVRRERPLQRMHQNLNTLFDRMWGNWLGPFERDFSSMRVWDFDVTENDKEITVRAELPGFEENELDIQLTNDILTIKAEKEEHGEGEEEYRSFFRRVTLPSGMDADNVRATYRSGVLGMHIPRVERG